MNRKEQRFYKDCDLLKKGNNPIYVWNGCGYSLQEVSTNRKQLSIEELAYICIKSGKGSFLTQSQIEIESKEQHESLSFYEDRFYQENECYAYCDMLQYGLENGYLLIENMRSDIVEIHS